MVGVVQTYGGAAGNMGSRVVEDRCKVGNTRSGEGGGFHIKNRILSVSQSITVGGGSSL